MSNNQELKLWELDNPSDPYTFYAESVELAGVAACLLSSGFGAHQPRDHEAERTPVMFGWEDWFKGKGITDLEAFISDNAAKLADIYDSFLIGDESRREDVESMLAMLSEDKKEEWRSARQDRKRTSMNQIGERAYELAEIFRKKAESSQGAERV